MHISPNWLTGSIAAAAIVASLDHSAAQNAPKDPVPELQVARDGKIIAAAKAQDRIPQSIQMAFETDAAPAAGRAPCAARSTLTPDAAEALVRRIAEAEDFYPDFVLAVARRESRFDANALSESGAFGLMQLMPATAERFGVDRCEPEGNVRGGIRYLRVLWERLRNPFYILAAYNAGEAAVAEHRGIPPFPETIGFVAAVISDFYGYPPPNAASGIPPGTRALATGTIAPPAAAAPRRGSPVRHASSNTTSANTLSTRTGRSARANATRQDWLVLHME
jgi:soluble lytic murein transglycosylase-like protein